MSNNLNGKFYSNQIRRNSRRLNRQIANNSKNFFQVKNWEAQGFIDEGVDKWRPVEGKPAGQKILVRTGRLRRDVIVRVLNRIRSEIVFGAPYASFVNKLRQFVGKSRTLDRENEQIITKFIGRLLR